MTALSVNVNKVAWLRNSRPGTRPDVVALARIALQAGAAGITVHPRPDARHIHAQDVYMLKVLVDSFPGRELNIEGNPDAAPRDHYPGFDHLIETVRPHQCTLVPDDDDQQTSDHGWDLAETEVADNVANHTRRYRSLGVRVSLFMDPEPDDIECASRIGVDRIELYTGPFAKLATNYGLHHPDTAECLRCYRDAAHTAARLGLGVNAGHDLDLANLAAFLNIGEIAEVSIGHALIADALLFGLAATVGRYVAVTSHHARNGEP